MSAVVVSPCACWHCQVLHEYQRRDGLMQQLLSERDEMRRASRRSNTESSKLERERDEARQSAARLKVGGNHSGVACERIEGKPAGVQTALSLWLAPDRRSALTPSTQRADTFTHMPVAAAPQALPCTVLHQLASHLKRCFGHFEPSGPAGAFAWG